MRFGFPKSARLQKRHEFVHVLKDGQRIFTRHFIVYVTTGEADRGRLGVTVSRKVGNAVARNRVRRLVREAFRTHPQWVRSPLDVVVIAKQSRDGTHGSEEPRLLELGQVAEEMGHALQRAQARPSTHRKPGVDAESAR